DRLTLGDVEIAFSIFDEPQKVSRAARDPELESGAGSPPPAAISETQLHITNQQPPGLRKLYEVSEKLMTMKDIDRLLESMVDATIEVAGAERGLILLNEDAFVSDPPGPKTEGEASSVPPSAETNGTPSSKGPVVRAARNVKRDALGAGGMGEPDRGISD